MRCKVCDAYINPADGDNWDDLCPGCADAVSAIIDRLTVPGPGESTVSRDRAIEIAKYRCDNETYRNYSERVANNHEVVCPHCLMAKDMAIEVKRWAELYHDGTDDEGGDTEWDDTSPAKCECGWTGTVGEARKAFERASKDGED